MWNYTSLIAAHDDHDEGDSERCLPFERETVSRELEEVIFCELSYDNLFIVYVKFALLVNFARRRIDAYNIVGVIHGSSHRPSRKCVNDPACRRVVV